MTGHAKTTKAHISIRTQFAGRYAAQLVSHWKHHNPELDVAALEQAQRAIEEHIDRFGFREKQVFDWSWRSPTS